MTKVVLNDIASLANTTSAKAVLNDNFDAIEEAFDNTLSRDGSTPNQMEADIDLNSNDLLNVNSIDAAQYLLNGVPFEQAVTFGTSSYDLFNGTNVQTDYTLSFAPGSVANLDVSVSGVTQRPGLDYNLVGNLLQFVSPPPAGTNNILVRYDIALMGTDFLLRSDLASDASTKGASLVGITGADGVFRTVADLAGDNGSKMLRYKRTATGSVARTVHERLSEYVSVKDFGAIGDGGLHPLSERYATLAAAQAVYPFATSLTEQIDRCAIQAAMNASVKVLVPDGLYRVDATLVGQNGLNLIGSTPEACRFWRTTAYGDTLQIGVLGGATAGAVRIEGIWFWHQYEFNNGFSYIPGTSTALLNKNNVGSHINLISGQNVRIIDCWFEGNRNHILITDSFNVWIVRSNFVGLWDNNVTDLQDTENGIYCQASVPGSTRCDNINIFQNRINGYGHSAPVDITTNGVTVNKAVNAGIKYGIRFRTAERFTIADNYIGGQAGHSILIEAHSITAHGEIHDNMLDAAFDYSILIRTLLAGQQPTFINIHNNTGVGYGFDLGFVCLQDFAGNDPAYQVHIKDNIGQFYRGTPIKIDRGVGIQISGNTMSAYNSDGSTTPDPTTQAGCFVGSAATLVHSFGNSWGGGINNPAGSNNCCWGIYWQNLAGSGASALERSLGLGLAGGTLVGGGSQTYPT